MYAHLSQQKALASRKTVNTIRAGRRWGKTTLLTLLAYEAIQSGKRVLILAPTIYMAKNIRDEVIRWTRKRPPVRRNVKDTIDFENGASLTTVSAYDSSVRLRGRTFDLALFEEVDLMGEPKESYKAVCGCLSMTGEVWLTGTPEEGGFLNSIATNTSYSTSLTFDSFENPVNKNL